MQCLPVIWGQKGPLIHRDLISSMCRANTSFSALIKNFVSEENLTIQQFYGKDNGIGVNTNTAGGNFAGSLGGKYGNGENPVAIAYRAKDNKKIKILLLWKCALTEYDIIDWSYLADQLRRFESAVNSSSYPINGTVLTGMWLSDYDNPNVKWEQVSALTSIRLHLSQRRLRIVHLIGTIKKNNDMLYFVCRYLPLGNQNYEATRYYTELGYSKDRKVYVVLDEWSPTNTSSMIPSQGGKVKVSITEYAIELFPTEKILNQLSGVSQTESLFWRDQPVYPLPIYEGLDPEVSATTFKIIRHLVMDFGFSQSQDENEKYNNLQYWAHLILLSHPAVRNFFGKSATRYCWEHNGILNGNVRGTWGNYSSAPGQWLFGEVPQTNAHKGSNIYGSAKHESDRMHIIATVQMITFRQMWQGVYEGVSGRNNTLILLKLDQDGATTTDEAKDCSNNTDVLRQDYRYLKFAGRQSSAARSTERADVWIRILLRRYLGKVYLYQKKYDQALVLFQEVIGSKDITVMPFQNNFDVTTEDGPEALLVSKHAINPDGSGDNANVGDMLSGLNGNNPVGCCGFFQPTNRSGKMRIRLNGNGYNYCE
ncbi:hypothetical protein FQR65_LT17917 [Abscondita terminalis]|nr:hypothetical protein FQR65_LT17917 [Abscondita terminalis]